MRLISAHIRSYRIHADRRIEFDAARTLIGGSNESGKSTVAEAIHRALFLRAKTTGEARDAMNSHVHAGHPEVDVDFVCGKQRYSLRKRFSGPGGTCSLTEHGGQTWNGDAAEERLAALLGVDPPTSGRGAAARVTEQWAHLWVYQGSAGSDPTATTAQQHNALMQRLQEDGGTAVMQSQRDAAVTRAITARYESIFKSGGYRKDSDAQRALATLAAATQRRKDCEAQLKSLEDAVRDLEEAEQTLRDTPIPKLEAELRDAEAAKARVSELQREVEQRRSELERVEASHKALSESINSIEATLKTLQASRQELAPKENELLRLIALREDSVLRQKSAGQELLTRRDELREARRRRDVFSAHADLLRLADNVKLLHARRTRIAEQRERRTQIAQELAMLPAISAEQLDDLRELERESVRTSTVLAAMAAGFEILTTDQPIFSEALQYAEETRYVISEDTDISVGNGVRIRITPGGGTSLSDARRQMTYAHSELTEALAILEVKDLKSATAAAERRRQLEYEDTTCVDALTNASAATLEQDTEELEKLRMDRAGESKRQQALGAPIALAESLDAAEVDRVRADTELQVADRSEGEARIRLEQAEVFLVDARKKDDAGAQSVAELRESVRNLEADHVARERIHGDEKSRSERLRRSEIEVEAARSQAAVSEQQLALLEPESIEADVLRFRRSIERAAESREEAIKRQAVATDQLRLDGIFDPSAALTVAQAEEDEELVASRQAIRRANAVGLLSTLFNEKEQGLAARFTQPLLERVGAYLATMYGRGVSAAVENQGGGLTRLRVSRSGYGEMAYDFDALSGGTKEQVATAFRLAMAEVLAVGHDACLPIVLDDAFAYTDNDRVRGVQRMLDLAASRGLQVIVLSCNPDEYAGFGARRISLPALHAGGRASTNATVPTLTNSDDSANSRVVEANGFEAPAEEQQEKEAASVDRSSSERDHAFLTTLRALGGTQGNSALRKELGWDQSIYDEVKSRLVSGGQIKPGRGRGGSVSIESGV